jgi:hypothetical protein
MEKSGLDVTDLETGATIKMTIPESERKRSPSPVDLTDD